MVEEGSIFGQPPVYNCWPAQWKAHVALFSILLELGQGNLIHRFYEQDFVDSKLLIDLNKLKTLYNSWGVPDADSCAEKFNKEQWRFCPAKLRYANSRDFFPSHRIPITKKEDINKKGGTAAL